MKALSIRQPWAWAIVHGGKDIENRTWSTRYRGPVLIHASAGGTAREFYDAADWLREQHLIRDYWRAASHDLPRLPTREQLPRGGIVGRATIVDCVERSASPWFVGPIAFVLADVEPLRFVACKGALGLFDVPAHVVAELAL